MLMLIFSQHIVVGSEKKSKNKTQEFSFDRINPLQYILTKEEAASKKFGTIDFGKLPSATLTLSSSNNDTKKYNLSSTALYTFYNHWKDTLNVTDDWTHPILGIFSLKTPSPTVIENIRQSLFIKPNQQQGKGSFSITSVSFSSTSSSSSSSSGDDDSSSDKKLSSPPTSVPTNPHHTSSSSRIEEEEKNVFQNTQKTLKLLHDLEKEILTLENNSTLAAPIDNDTPHVNGNDSYENDESSVESKDKSIKSPYSYTTKIFGRTVLTLIVLYGLWQLCKTHNFLAYFSH